MRRELILMFCTLVFLVALPISFAATACTSGAQCVGANNVCSISGTCGEVISRCGPVFSSNDDYLLSSGFSSSSTPICLRPAHGSLNSVTLDCQGNVIRGDGKGTFLNLYKAQQVSIKNCVLVNFDKGIIVNQSNTISLINNTFLNVKDAVIVENQSVAVHLHDNLFSKIGNVAIAVQDKNVEVALDGNWIRESTQGILLKDTFAPAVDNNRVCNTVTSLTCSGIKDIISGTKNEFDGTITSSCPFWPQTPRDYATQCDFDKDGVRDRDDVCLATGKSGVIHLTGDAKGCYLTDFNKDECVDGRDITLFSSSLDISYLLKVTAPTLANLLSDSFVDNKDLSRYFGLLSLTHGQGYCPSAFIGQSKPTIGFTGALMDPTQIRSFLKKLLAEG